MFFEQYALAKYVRRLPLSFRRIFEDKKEELLPEWIVKAKESGITSLKNFAKGLENDYAAVTAAATYEWSNGQVEGQINRLKMIKRQIYGRAGFDLLRKRVIFYSCDAYCIENEQEPVSLEYATVNRISQLHSYNMKK